MFTEVGKVKAHWGDWDEPTGLAHFWPVAQGVRSPGRACVPHMFCKTETSVCHRVITLLLTKDVS